MQRAETTRHSPDGVHGQSGMQGIGINLEHRIDTGSALVVLRDTP